MAFAIKTGGSKICAEVVTIHPLASVTVTVYIPAKSPDGFCTIPPPLSQLKAYGSTPPITVKLISPSVSPLQSSASPKAEASNKTGSVISVVTVIKQALASVMVTV